MSKAGSAPAGAAQQSDGTYVRTIGNDKSPLKVYGVGWCGHCQNTKKNFSAAGLNYQFIDATGNAKVKAYPTLVCQKTHVGEMSAAQAAKWCPDAVPKNGK